MAARALPWVTSLPVHRARTDRSTRSRRENITREWCSSRSC